MLKQFVKALAPARNKFARAVGGTVGNGSNASAFERNRESKEQQLSTILKGTLPGITYLSVQDISGGCGAMFEITIEAKEFIGLSTIKQHRLVTDTLKNEIAEMHGIRINTTPPQTD